MSGGALDYMYCKLEDVIWKIPSDTPERRAFKAHLATVVPVLRAIEYNMSGDGDDAEIPLIRGLLGTGKIIESQVEEAKRVMAELKQMLEDVEKW